MRGYVFALRRQLWVRGVSTRHRGRRALDTGPALCRHRLWFASPCIGRCRTMCSLAGRYPRAETRTANTYRIRVVVSWRFTFERMNGRSAPESGYRPRSRHSVGLAVTAGANGPFATNFGRDCCVIQAPGSWDSPQRRIRVQMMQRRSRPLS
jgi:hypothetical protein